MRKVRQLTPEGCMTVYGAPTRERAMDLTLGVVGFKARFREATPEDPTSAPFVVEIKPKEKS